MATTSYSDWVNYASTSCSLRIKWEVTDSATSCTVKATLQRWDKYAVTTGGVYSIAMTSCTTSTGNSFPNSSSNNTTRNGKSLSHTYTKTHSAQTVTVTISTNEWFDTISDSGWTKIGSVSFSKTLTVSKKTSYTVKYAANGGSSTPSSQTKWYGESLTLRGSIFRSSAAATAYTVTLNGNGAANSSLSASRTTSYTFSKWKATSGTTYSASGSYTANAATTMTAQWTSSTSTSAVSLPTKTLTGYTFKRWNTKSDDTGTGYSNGTNNYTPTGNVTLYAIWNRTVTFHANNGSGAPSAQTAVKSSAITLSSTIPTRSGYRFTGWNTAQNGSGTAYAAGSTYAKDMPTVTLYAQWQVVLNITNLTVARGNYAGSTFTADPMGTHVKVSYSWNDGGNGASTPPVFTTQAAGPQIDSISGVSTVSGTATRYIQHPGVASEIISVTATNADGSMTESVTLSSGYTSPMMYAVATNRVAETSPGSGVYVLDDAGEVLEITARWAVCESANQRVTMTATAKDFDGNNALSTTYLIGTASSGAAGTFGGISKFYISSVTFEADKQYTVTVNLKDALGGNGVSKGNVLSSAFFPMDVLGDSYYYEPTGDSSYNSAKTYYVMDGTTGWYKKFTGSSFASGTTYYEKTGPRPGHGISFGAPCKEEGFHIAMQAFDVNNVPGSIVPIGTVIDYAGSTVPRGYLECNGQAVSRTTYALLFAAIGTAWGTGDGSTTFNLPDFRGRVSIGAGTGTASGATAHVFASTGGDERMPSHSHGNTIKATTPKFTHSITQPVFKLPNHTHPHEVYRYKSGGDIKVASGSGGYSWAAYNNTGNPNSLPNCTRSTNVGVGDHAATDCTMSGSVSSEGSGTAGNMQPFATLRKIIRAA